MLLDFQPIVLPAAVGRQTQAGTRVVSAGQSCPSIFGYWSIRMWFPQETIKGIRTGEKRQPTNAALRFARVRPFRMYRTLPLLTSNAPEPAVYTSQSHSGPRHIAIGKKSPNWNTANVSNCCPASPRKHFRLFHANLLQLWFNWAPECNTLLSFNTPAPSAYLHQCPPQQLQKHRARMLLSWCTMAAGTGSMWGIASRNLLTISKRDPENSPGYSEDLYLCGNH